MIMNAPTPGAKLVKKLPTSLPTCGKPDKSAIPPENPKVILL